MKRSSKVIHVLLSMALFAAGGLTGFFLLRFMPHNSSISRHTPQISSDISERETDVSHSWQILVSTTRRECAKDKSGASLDYESMHKHFSGTYGVIVLAWPQSEYIIDLYRYDPSKKVWTASPRRETDFGDEIDVSKASVKWTIPKEVLNGWINEAADYMKKKYGNGEN